MLSPAIGARVAKPRSRSRVAPVLLLAIAVASGWAVVVLALRTEWAGHLAWLALVPTLHVQRTRRPLHAALWTALGAWVLYSMIAEPYRPLSPILVVAIPTLIALWYALAGAATAYLFGGNRWSPAGVASLWILVELLKESLGLPFGSLGYSQWNAPVVRQAASAVGAVGVSWLVWFVNAWLAGVLAGRGAAALDARWRCRTSLSAVALLLLVLGWAERGSPAGTSSAPVTFILASDDSTTEARLRARVDPIARAEGVERLLATSAAAAPRDPGSPLVVVWPETAWQSYVEHDPDARGSIARGALPLGATLLTGALGRATQAQSDGFNSAFTFSGDGEILDRYDKVRLIPFDEYQPLRALSKLLFSRTVITAFAAGESVAPVDLAWGRLGLCICYEETFAEGFRRQVDMGSRVLATLANYSYFPTPSAPRFMHSLAVFRAIENGRWLVRCCNRGPLEVIDPWGATAARREFDPLAGPGEGRTLQVEVPLLDGRTFFTAHAHGFLHLVCAGVVLIFALLRRYPRGSDALAPAAPARSIHVRCQRPDGRREFQEIRP
jgi:apolipoprotein N-acyltransferase